jgi:hypothetical protein
MTKADLTSRQSSILFSRVRKRQEPMRVQTSRSMNSLSVGFPGLEKSSVTRLLGVRKS